MNHFPALLVKFPDGCEGRRATFFLAAEEYIAGWGSGGCYLFTWQLSPTVVMGRNQVAENEVDIAFCHEHNIDVVRRHSGGGAIYADRGNIMISLITEAGPVEPLFKEYSIRIADMLTAFGATAEATGRNDVVVEGSNGSNGGKVCGNAFYHMTHSNIVHGTMLFDTDFDMMMGALRPPIEKLKRHGVESVRQRVALLKDYLPFGVTELRGKIEENLTAGIIPLTDKDIKEIEKIEQWKTRKPASGRGTRHLVPRW